MLFITFRLYFTVAAVLDHEAIAGLTGSKPSGLRGRSSSRADDTPEHSLDSLMKSVSNCLMEKKSITEKIPYIAN